MDPEYIKRVQQRDRFARWGTIGIMPSVLTFFVGLIFGKSLLITIGQVLLYASGSFIIVFSHIGWSRNKLADLVFNKFSILIALLGFGLVFLFTQYGLQTLNIGYILVVISFVLVFVGNRLSSPINHDSE
ncbi:MAG: hypothetical protein H6658_04045 [Ardenticatenaceae bacterium]|nr:hypothetical protein [Ardenticatenaceae bacterium]